MHLYNGLPMPVLLAVFTISEFDLLSSSSQSSDKLLSSAIVPTVVSYSVAIIWYLLFAPEGSAEWFRMFGSFL